MPAGSVVWTAQPMAEQCADPTVDGTDGVVSRLVRCVGEARLSVTDRAQGEAERLGDWRRREPPVEKGLQVLLRGPRREGGGSDLGSCQMISRWRSSPQSPSPTGEGVLVMVRTSQPARLLPSAAPDMMAG